MVTRRVHRFSYAEKLPRLRLSPPSNPSQLSSTRCSRACSLAPLLYAGSPSAGTGNGKANVVDRKVTGRPDIFAMRRQSGVVWLGANPARSRVGSWPSRPCVSSPSHRKYLHPTRTRMRTDSNHAIAFTACLEITLFVILELSSPLALSSAIFGSFHDVMRHGLNVTAVSITSVLLPRRRKCGIADRCQLN